MTRRFLPVVFVAVSALAGWPLSAVAKPRKPRQATEAAVPAPTPEEVGAPTAHLRLWKASDSQEAKALHIRLLPGGNGGKAVDVAASTERYQFGNYTDVPAGAGTIEIAAAGQAPVQLGVHLAKEQNRTLLVRIHKGVPFAELVDDTPPSVDYAPAFHVLNLMSGGKGEVQIKLGDALSARLNASGGSLRTQGVKPALYQVVVSGTDNDGQALNWNGETDLRKVQRATLIICPDAYGRIRPRLIEDGMPPDAPSATKP